MLAFGSLVPTKLYFSAFAQSKRKRLACCPGRLVDLRVQESPSATERRPSGAAIEVPQGFVRLLTSRMI